MCEPTAGTVVEVAVVPKFWVWIGVGDDVTNTVSVEACVGKGVCVTVTVGADVLVIELPRPPLSTIADDVLAEPDAVGRSST